MKIEIRFATIEDADIILFFIKALARHERLEKEVTATKDKLIDSIFIRKKAEVLIARADDKDVGFMLFFHNYSTYLGSDCLYLEDYFVLEDYRNLGIGKKLFKKLTQIALERDCERIDWLCLDWNTPAVDFYKKIGANVLTDWSVRRLEGGMIKKLSEEL